MTRNIYMTLFIQALLTILLFFSEGYLRYATIFLYALFDAIILISLLRSKWGAEDMFIFLTLFVSAIYIVFYSSMSRNSVIMIGIGLFLLWVLSALLVIEPKQRLRQLVKPSLPDTAEQMFPVTKESKSSKDSGEQLQVYDVRDLQKRWEKEIGASQEQKKRQEAKLQAKIRANALAYELEREAAELKRAEKYVQKRDSEHQVSELTREAAELRNADAYLRQQSIRRGENELVREASELRNADAYLRQQSIRRGENELVREALELEKAEKALKQKIAPAPSKSKIKSVTTEISREAKILQDAQEKLEVAQQYRKAKKLKEEVQKLADAEKKIRVAQKKQTLEKLKKETRTLKDAARKISIVQKAQAENRLKQEAKTLKDAARKISIVQKAQAENRLKQEAKDLEDAQKQIKEVQFLNKQQELTRQAVELAKAQAQINAAERKFKINKTKIKSTPALKKEPVFATKTGNNFHETGCMVIKKVPRKNLILFNNPKDALKKGYKPCNVCKP